MKILHLTPYFSRKGTGVTNVVRALARHQVQLGHEVQVFSSFDEFSYDESRHDMSFFDCRFFKVKWFRSFYYCPDLIFHILNFKPDIIHSHGIWTYFSWAAYKTAKLLNVPHVVTPHGTLNQWFLSWKKWKKVIAKSIYQKKILIEASRVYCFESELEGVAQWGISGKAKLSVNGTDGDVLSKERNRIFFNEKHPELKNKKILSFISRIHPQKGLIPLLQGFSKVAGQHSDWQLVVAGADEYNYLPEVRAEAKRLKLAEKVSFIGYVNSIDKWHYYLAADAFVLTSQGEGFSMSILEALAAGTPVCISKYCFFDDVQKRNCGFVCDLCSQSVQAALNGIMSLNDAERKKMGENGRALIREKYLWGNIVGDLLLDYKGIISENGSITTEVLFSEITNRQSTLK